MGSLSNMPENSSMSLAARVISHLAKLELEPTPRNYEVVYEALSGTNPSISTALAGLPDRPGQAALDEVAATWLQRDKGQAIVGEAHHAIDTKLNEILSLMTSERSSLERYGRILDETSAGLKMRDRLSREFFEKILNAVSAATSAAIDSGKTIASRMTDKSSELEAVKAKLDEYKRLSETDALTDLSNRRAFDMAMMDIFRDKSEALFSSLVLIDLDRFKHVNDSFGHPVGDRILQIVAGIIRNNVTSDVFVARTGGEEFALIVNGPAESGIVRMCEAIREAIAATPFVNTHTGIDYGPITASLGLCMASEASNPDDLYAKADRSLYAAKSGGRNRTITHSSLKQGTFKKSWLLYSSE